MASHIVSERGTSWAGKGPQTSTRAGARRSGGFDINTPEMFGLVPFPPPTVLASAFRGVRSGARAYCRATNQICTRPGAADVNTTTCGELVMTELVGMSRYYKKRDLASDAMRTVYLLLCSSASLQAAACRLKVTSTQSFLHWHWHNLDCYAGMSVDALQTRSSAANRMGLVSVWTRMITASVVIQKSSESVRSESLTGSASSCRPAGCN